MLYEGTIFVMDRIDKIMEHPLYVREQARIDEMETDRKFCRHGIEHCLDVARILYILTLEQHTPYPKDMIYALALLHDIGRGEEYRTGTPHSEIGAEMAREIMAECEFGKEEVAMMIEAILNHRNAETEGDNSLSSLLFQADKLSRNCYKCDMYEECYWEDSRKNSTVRY